MARVTKKDVEERDARIAELEAQLQESDQVATRSMSDYSVLAEKYQQLHQIYLDAIAHDQRILESVREIEYTVDVLTAAYDQERAAHKEDMAGQVRVVRFLSDTLIAITSYGGNEVSIPQALAEVALESVEIIEPIPTDNFIDNPSFEITTEAWERIFFDNDNEERLLFDNNNECECGGNCNCSA